MELDDYLSPLSRVIHDMRRWLESELRLTEFSMSEMGKDRYAVLAEVWSHFVQVTSVLAMVEDDSEERRKRRERGSDGRL